MAKYGKKAAQKVKKVMRERKKGTLKSGRSGKKVPVESKPSPSVCQKPVERAPKFRARNPRKNSPALPRASRSLEVRWPLAAIPSNIIRPEYIGSRSRIADRDRS